jgi:RNA polymerase sigma-70 factor (ECF subfamily)
MTWAAHRGLYERLARRFYRGVYNYLRWLCRDADLAADLTQQAFVQIWRHPPEMRGEKPLRAWVYRVARNEYLQHRRRANPEMAGFDECSESAPQDWARFDPHMRLEQSELRRAVRAALERLPEAYREVMVLHNLEGLSLDQVAAALSLPTGTVKSRRARAFALLRDMLATEVNSDEMQPSASDASG